MVGGDQNGLCVFPVLFWIYIFKLFIQASQEGREEQNLAICDRNSELVTVSTHLSV